MFTSVLTRHDSILTRHHEDEYTLKDRVSLFCLLNWMKRILEDFALIFVYYLETLRLP